MKLDGFWQTGALFPYSQVEILVNNRACRRGPEKNGQSQGWVETLKGISSFWITLFTVPGPERRIKFHIVPPFPNPDPLLSILSVAEMAIVFLLVASRMTALSFLSAGDVRPVGSSFGSHCEWLWILESDILCTLFEDPSYTPGKFWCQKSLKSNLRTQREGSTLRLMCSDRLEQPVMSFHVNPGLWENKSNCPHKFNRTRNAALEAIRSPPNPLPFPKLLFMEKGL